ncbi:insulinoma-associated protein 1a [Colossoma macropomum]|uniref:insulinoma-associated protein 1a n=1 Tax=Colossoma macropomum TaxID=42526 RepID=UPI0018652D9F|nr:insulinoma-associated protein 1a [Colossoma macropomum]
MPRGFLVKRSRRAPYGAVYRAREDEHNELEQPTTSTTISAMTPTITARAADDSPPQQLFPARSPAVAESFPLSASSVARALLLQQQQGHAESAVRAHSAHSAHNAHAQSARSRKKPARVARKHQQHLSAEDEESTSPVLGLAILRREKERSPAPGRAHAGGTSGSGASGSGSGGARPLREFICQLCKEEYADPFALAQHRCSRIVRVEYRCPECAKVFSCPANLASHRRWHRPREQQQQQQQQQHGQGHADHNNNNISMSIKHADSKDNKEEGKENASSRRHLTTTTASTITAAPHSVHETEQGRFTCGLCRGHARAGAGGAAGGEERALWPGSAHVGVGMGAVGVSVGGIGGGVEFCPSLYSAHGLSAHLSRCHTAESARAAMMHVPPRPVC